MPLRGTNSEREKAGGGQFGVSPPPPLPSLVTWYGSVGRWCYTGRNVCHGSPPSLPPSGLFLYFLATYRDAKNARNVLLCISFPFFLSFLWALVCFKNVYLKFIINILPTLFLFFCVSPRKQIFFPLVVIVVLLFNISVLFTCQGFSMEPFSSSYTPPK